MDRQREHTEHIYKYARIAVSAALLVTVGRLGIERAESMSPEAYAEPQATGAPAIAGTTDLAATPEPFTVQEDTLTESTPVETLIEPPVASDTLLPTPVPDTSTLPPPVETVSPATEVPVVSETIPPVAVPSEVVVPEVQSPINAPIGGLVNGTLSIAAANIRSEDTFAQNLNLISKNNPDFILLNEVSTRSIPHMEESAPGYSAYRDNTIDTTSDSRNDLANAIMWHDESWDKLDAGRIKITNHDYLVFDGKNADWNRYAVWGVFERETDGAIVSVIDTHMMTNPEKFPRQWRETEPPMTRIEQYVDSMDNLEQLAGTLAVHGPVLIGGDMNSHPDDGNWTAVHQLQKEAYDYSRPSGEVIYVFNPPGTKIIESHDVMLQLHGDHNNKSVQTKIDMNGVGPTNPTGS